VTARRDRRGTHAAVADGSVQGLLADAEKTRRLARADELASRQAPLQALDVLWQEAAMTAGRDERRLEQSPRDGAENSRSADTKALC
jgi:hypothetical protein